MPRYAARRDDNEPQIIEALRASGWGVYQVDGSGFPDLVVAKGKITWLAEVIAPEKQKKYRRQGGLTDRQVEFHRDWPGMIFKLRSVEDALDVVRFWEERR